MFDNAKRERARQVHAIAWAFSSILGDWFTKAEGQQVLERNRAEPCHMVCHSHDFCDANEAMFEAFKQVTGRDIDGDCEPDCVLWGDAWNQAVAAEFFNRI